MAKENFLVDKRQLLGWAMYDWANSAFSTVVVSTLLGPYLSSLLRRSSGDLSILGLSIEPDSFYPLCVSLSVFLQVLMLPLIGRVVDAYGLKKETLIVSALIGSGATVLLVGADPSLPFLSPVGAAILGGVLFVVANLFYGISVLAYNAFLPEIAPPCDRDRVSSIGWALGYLGGGLALGLVLIMVYFWGDKGWVVRFAFGLAGLWWLVFTLAFTNRLLAPGTTVGAYGDRTVLSSRHPLVFDTVRIISRFREMLHNYPEAFRFLAAYLLYNDGIQTVIVVASLFAATELKVGPKILIKLILMIQFLSVPGTMFFALIAKRLGTKSALVIALAIWILICLYACLWLFQVWQLFLMGAMVSLVLGGSQALSRSLYAQLIPRRLETEFFSFYEISERGSSWIGPLVFAVAVGVTGNTRLAVLIISLFMVAGLFLLAPLSVAKGMKDAGNDMF